MRIRLLMPTWFDCDRVFHRVLSYAGSIIAAQFSRSSSRSKSALPESRCVADSRSTSLAFTHWRTQRQSCRRTNARARRLIQTTSFRSPIIWMSDNRVEHTHYAQYKRTTVTRGLWNQECCSGCGCRGRANAISASLWVYSIIDSDHTRSSGPSWSDSLCVRWEMWDLCKYLRVYSTRTVVLYRFFAYPLPTVTLSYKKELHGQGSLKQIMKRLLK